MFRSLSDIRGAAWRAWRNAIDASDFGVPSDVERLFRLAVNLGFVRDEQHERLMVFAQAAMACRKGLTRERKTGFAVNVLRGDWFHSAKDEEAAAATAFGNIVTT